MSELLKDIDSPRDLQKLSLHDLRLLSSEIRELIIEVVSNNKGHLASNLGVVELTLALHYCFDFLHDRLVWDVGHQGYTHKIITGRKENFHTLRTKNGLSGFINRDESPYDTFSFGHTGTSISAALGLACANHSLNRDRSVVAVIGDGALASGMPFEGLFHAGALGKNMLVVLNDNKMSISPTVGAVARYLSRIRSSPSYSGVKGELTDLLRTLQPFSDRVDALLKRMRDGLQAALTPGGIFTELGFRYYGPVDGHDVDELVSTFKNLKQIEGPILLHTLTEKGHGFLPARNDPTGFHSSSRFQRADGTVQTESSEGVSYSEAFGSAVREVAEDEPALVAMTAAMPDGTGLSEFREAYPDRFYDVGICEQHGVGMANGLTAGDMKPVFAVYSTFLQRAFDQLFHDVCLQDAPVVFGIDRAGLVGADGASHHGLYDIAYCRLLPNFVVMAPRDGMELRQMVELAVADDRPCAIRYPRESVPESPGTQPDFEVGQADVVREGKDAAIIAYGAMVNPAQDAARILEDREGLSVTVVNARFAKPLDGDLISETVIGHDAVIVAEDHAVAGGFGSAVLEMLAGRSINSSHVELAGVPDRKIPHASRSELLQDLELDAEGLAARLQRKLVKTEA